MSITASRYHDISCGHRVVGHESKCRHLHGHNYRIHFKVESDQGTDDIGRVLDFSVIKSKLCIWVETNWDHKFLAFEDDPLMKAIHKTSQMPPEDAFTFLNSMVWTPFNPTAENMAQYLVECVGPMQLKGTGCRLVEVTIEETMKCSATFSG